MSWDLLSAFWDWFTTYGAGSCSARESGSTTVRNLALAVVAVVALPLALWRSMVAARQASIAQQDLLDGRYQNGAEMLGSDLLSVRLGGIYALDNLAEEYPEQHHLRIMHLFCAFIRHPSGKADQAVAPTSEEPSTPDARDDEGWREGSLRAGQQPWVAGGVQVYCVATVGCEPAWPRDPELLMSGIGPVVTFVAGRRPGEFRDLVTHANTCAAPRGSRIPSRAGALYGRMRICSFDTAALGRAHLIVAPFPRRLRRSSDRPEPSRYQRST